MSNRHEIAVEKKDEVQPEIVSDKNSVTLVPPVDIYENEDGILLFADMPGVKKEDLNVEVDKGVLTITGDISYRGPAQGKKLYAEFKGSGYKRMFTLGPDVDSNKIEARMQAGVLRLFLPKSEASKPRKIEVKVV